MNDIPPEEFRQALEDEERDSPLWRALRALRDVPVEVLRAALNRGESKEDADDK